MLSSVYNLIITYIDIINPFNSKSGFISSYLSNDDYHLCQRLSHIHQSVDFLDRTSFLQKVNWIIHRDVNWSRHQYGIQWKEVTISHTFSHDVKFQWSKAVVDLWTINQLHKVFQSNLTHNIRSISISSQKHILLLVSKAAQNASKRPALITWQIWDVLTDQTRSKAYSNCIAYRTSDIANISCFKT